MVLHELTGAHISQYHLKSVLTLMGPLTCSILYIVYSNSLPPSYPDILLTPPLPPPSPPQRFVRFRDTCISSRYNLV